MSVYDLTFNTHDLSTYGVTVINHFEPRVRAGDRHTLIGTPGGAIWASGALPQAVPLKFDCRIEGATPDELRQNVSSLAAALRSTTWATLYYYFPDRHWLALHDGEDVALKFNCDSAHLATSANFELTFMCQPTMIAETPVTQTASITTTPQSVNVPASGVISGDGLTYPVVTFQNNTGHDLNDATPLIFTNTTRMSSVAFPLSGGPLPDTYYIRLTCATRVCEISAPGTAWFDASDLTLGDDFWLALQGGVSNVITVTGCDGNGALSITYTPRWG